MFLQSQVWDTKTGQVVWEGMGGVAASKSYPINVVEHTTANLAKVLAQNKEKIYLSYSEIYFVAPCKTKANIYTPPQQVNIILENKSKEYIWVCLLYLLC